MEVDKDSFKRPKFGFLVVSRRIEGAAQIFESEYNIPLDEEVFATICVLLSKKMFFYR